MCAIGHICHSLCDLFCLFPQAPSPILTPTVAALVAHCYNPDKSTLGLGSPSHHCHRRPQFTAEPFHDLYCVCLKNLLLPVVTVHYNMDGNGMVDQEKTAQLHHNTPALHQHNESPSQKATWPRWDRKGKERSTIARMCTWVVDHQIGKDVNYKNLLQTRC